MYARRASMARDRMLASEFSSCCESFLRSGGASTLRSPPAPLARIAASKSSVSVRDGGGGGRSAAGGAGGGFAAVLGAVLTGGAGAGGAFGAEGGSGGSAGEGAESEEEAAVETRLSERGGGMGGGAADVAAGFETEERGESTGGS